MGIGYGEVMKIYAIAAESQEPCAAEVEAVVETEEGLLKILIRLILEALLRLSSRVV